jgi:phage tail sheath gpL-like
MSELQTSVPTSIDTPGNYHVISHVPAGGSLVALDQRALLVGMKATAGTATAETPVRVLDVADAITKFGQGSELALMAAVAFAQGILNAAQGRGGMPELWACPIAAPSGGGTAAAAQTLTVTGPATAAGTGHVRISGRDIFFGIASGDAQNTIATALKNAIAAKARELPVTAAVLANVVTSTHVTAGEHGNDVAYEVVSVPAGVAIASAQSVAGAGVLDITAALNAAVDKDYHAVPVSVHSANGVSDAETHLDSMWGPTEKKWRHLFMGDRASLGTAQGYATSADTEKMLVVSCEGCPNLPGEIATAAAIAAFGVDAPNANLDDVDLALYPPAASVVYSGAEVESAIDGGVTPLAPSFDGQRLRIVRLVTTKITDGGAPYKLLADLAYSRTVAYRATQYDLAFRRRFQQAILTDEVLQRIRDTCIEIDRSMEAAGYLLNVEDLVPQFRVERAGAPQGRCLVQAPVTVAGPLHQIVVEHLNYLGG